MKKKTKICTENLSNMLFAFAFLAVIYLLKATKSPKIASHGAVRVPSRAVGLFPALLTLMRTALIRAFSQWFCIGNRMGPSKIKD